MKSQKFISIIAFIFTVTACYFLQPDYLKMITANELNQIMQNEDIFLVDVHTPKQKPIKGTDLLISVQHFPLSVSNFYLVKIELFKKTVA